METIESFLCVRLIVISHTFIVLVKTKEELRLISCTKEIRHIPTWINNGCFPLLQTIDQSTL